MKPWKLSLILLAGSVLMSVLLWSAGLPFFFLLLFIPLVPFLSGPKDIRRCPVCGWETDGSERFCPYDATPLDRTDMRDGKKGEHKIRISK